MNPAKPCSVCGDACKSASTCRSLRVPPEGFYSGGGGGGGHSHDDDCDEPLIAPQPFAQTCSQDGALPSTRRARAWALHTIPNTLSSVAV